MTISVDKVLEERDVDAALYLLGRLLGLNDELLGDRREELEKLRTRVKKRKKLRDEERVDIVSTYREVIG